MNSAVLENEPVWGSQEGRARGGEEIAPALRFWVEEASISAVPSFSSGKGMRDTFSQTDQINHTKTISGPGAAADSLDGPGAQVKGPFITSGCVTYVRCRTELPCSGFAH